MVVNRIKSKLGSTYPIYQNTYLVEHMIEKRKLASLSLLPRALKNKKRSQLKKSPLLQKFFSFLFPLPSHPLYFPQGKRIHFSKKKVLHPLSSFLSLSLYFFTQVVSFKSPFPPSLPIPTPSPSIHLHSMPYIQKGC